MSWCESEYIKGAKQWDLRTGLFHLRVQDNGEGWFNWQVSPQMEDKNNFREDLRVAEGGETNPVIAKLTAVAALGKLLAQTTRVLHDAVGMT